MTIRASRLIIVALVLALVAAACSGGVAETTTTVDEVTGTTSSEGTQATDSGSEPSGSDQPWVIDEPLKVWIDPPREKAVTLYLETFPDANIEYEFVDRGEFPAQVLLFNAAGEGWPDVMFAEPEILARAADEQHDYPLDLTPYLSDGVVDGFYPGGIAPCLDGDRVLCLRNDIAHMVVWYNAPKMAEFGYELPTTWQEYEAFGEQVAADHPGFLIGAFGDEQALDTYYWPSRCPVQVLDGEGGVFIDLADQRCTRVTEMADNLIELGVLSKVGPFDPAFVEKIQNDEWLLFPAANWYGEFVFQGREDGLYYQTGEGQVGAAPPLLWEGEDVAWTGARGGAAWAVSQHTGHPEAAAHFVEWVTTSPIFQGVAGGYPAYAPAAPAWAGNINDNPLYANDVVSVVTEAADLLDPSWGSVRYDYLGTFVDLVIGPVQSGSTVAEVFGDLEEPLRSLAELNGYALIDSEPAR